jgi:uncharacterized membrane protein YadS
MPCAGKMMNDEIASAAVITKLARVMMLGPYLVILSRFTQRSDKGKAKIAIPWFAIAFVVVAGINSLAIVPAAVVKVLTKSSGIMLLTAMVRHACLCFHCSAAQPIFCPSSHPLCLPLSSDLVSSFV